MPSAEHVKVFFEQFGWPGLTVLVALFFSGSVLRILLRMMGKHEQQMEGHRIEMAKLTAVNEHIVVNLQALASEFMRHDQAEDQRHRDTRNWFSQ